MKIQFIHNLRGLAILFILLAHTISALPNSNVNEFLRNVFANSTILFVLIGGFLYSELRKKYTYKDFILSKFKKVILPYIFLSLPAALVYVFSLKTQHSWIDMSEFGQMTMVGKYLFLIVTGAHLGPLWFIPMVVIFYLLSPLFDILIKDEKLLLNVTVVALILAMIVGRPVSNSNVLNSFFYFVPVYMTGFVLNTRAIILTKIVENSNFLFLFSLFVIFIYSILFDYNSHIDIALKLCFFISLMAYFKRHVDRAHKHLGLLASLSFYIYFVHGYITALFRSLSNKYSWLFDNLLSFFVVFSVVLFLCLFSYWVARFFIRKNRAYLLGATV